MSDYMLSSSSSPSSLFAVKSKAKRAAQLAEVRKRRAVAYRLFAKKHRLHRKEL